MTASTTINPISKRVKFERKISELNGSENIFTFRTSKDEELLLKDLLRAITGHIISNKRIVAFSVVSDNTEEKTSYECDDFDGYEMLEDIIEIHNDKIKFIAQNNNVILHITYRKQSNNQDIPFIIHLNGYGHEGDNSCDSFACVNASVVWKEGNAVYSALALVTYDCNGFDAVKNKIDSAISQLDKDADKLSEEERQIIAGMFPKDNLKQGMYYLKNEQFADALSLFENEFKALNKENNINGREELYSSLAYNIGACYLQRYQFKKAIYYFELAFEYNYNKETVKSYLHTLACANDLQAKWILDLAKKDADKIAPEDKDFAQLLDDAERELNNEQKPNCEKNLFYQILSSAGILHSEVSSMIVEKSGIKPYLVSNQLDILGFNLLPELQVHKDMTLYLSYRSSRDSVCDELLEEGKEYPADESKKIINACPDKSKEKRDNEIILHISRESDIATVIAIIPSFCNLNNRNDGYPKVMTYRYYLSSVMTPEQFNELRSTAITKASNKENLDYGEYFSLGVDTIAHYYFIMGLQSYNYRINGSALFFLSQAYELVAAKRYTDKIDNIDKDMMLEAAYMIGHIYAENKEFDTALTYLRLLSHSGNIDWMKEYLNALAGFNDIRTPDIINEELSEIKKEKYNEYSSERIEEYESFLREKQKELTANN